MALAASGSQSTRRGDATEHTAATGDATEHTKYNRGDHEDADNQRQTTIAATRHATQPKKQLVDAHFVDTPC